MQNRNRGAREAIAFLAMLVACLATLLIVRAYIYSRVGYTPLPFGEWALYPLRTVLTVSTLGLAAALSSLAVRGWHSILFGTVAAFVAYLSWAIVQQNLIVNPDLWKLWERGWLSVGLAAALAGFVLSSLARLGMNAYHKLAIHPE